MRINPVSPNYYNFTAKLRDRAKPAPEEENDDDAAEIRFNDGINPLPYDADVMITKTDREGNTSNEFFKGGVYIVHETISPMKHIDHPFPADFQEIEVFDRQLGEHTSKRRYDNGTIDVLRRGRWDSKNYYEIEHQNAQGETTGFTRREYMGYSVGEPYYGYDFFCNGDIYFSYFQTRFDKDHKPYGGFEGLETVPGKKIKSL